jgi:hypothetical protein
MLEKVVFCKAYRAKTWKSSEYQNYEAGRGESDEL